MRECAEEHVIHVSTSIHVVTCQAACAARRDVPVLVAFLVLPYSLTLKHEVFYLARDSMNFVYALISSIKISALFCLEDGHMKKSCFGLHLFS